MIIDSISEDIFNTEAKHIAFAINKEGFNDAGFAGVVANKGWSKLMSCGEHEIGTVLSKKIKGKTYHALVCHSIKEGWGDNQAEAIKTCFNNIPVDNEPIASVAIGNGLIGMLSGADVEQIIYGMCDSDKKIILYSGFSLDKINQKYKEYKDNQRTLKK